jgi:hypothetical protein
MPTPSSFEKWSPYLQRHRWSILIAAIISWSGPAACVLGAAFFDFPRGKSLPILVSLSAGLMCLLWSFVMMPHFFDPVAGWLNPRSMNNPTVCSVLRWFRWPAALLIDGFVISSLAIPVFVVRLLADTQ